MVRGNKRQHRGGHQGGGRFAKKPKRSKQFWQQRKTAAIAPIPGNESSDENRPSSEEEDEKEEVKTHYDNLLNAFAAGEMLSWSGRICCFRLIQLGISPHKPGTANGTHHFLWQHLASPAGAGWG